MKYRNRPMVAEAVSFFADDGHRLAGDLTLPARPVAGAAVRLAREKGYDRLVIADVIHQANIDVDEKGTEAAAATAVVMRATALPAEPVIMHVDRPFLFALRDVPTGAILFLETSELRPSPEDVDSLLMDFENMGVLASIAGLVVARPYGYAPEDVPRLWAVVRERTEAFGFPVLAGTDTGHTTPLQTLPIGVVAELDASPGRFAILEPAVR